MGRGISLGLIHRAGYTSFTKYCPGSCFTKRLICSRISV
ncbi:MAG: hypothetical protein ACI9UA_003322, partial [Pseudoalteromonas tetraodonis]